LEASVEADRLNMFVADRLHGCMVFPVFSLAEPAVSPEFMESPLSRAMFYVNVENISVRSNSLLEYAKVCSVGF
jgi:hypothetical protein